MARFAYVVALAVAVLACTASAGSRNFRRGVALASSCQSVLASRQSNINTLTGPSAPTMSDADYFLAIAMYEGYEAASILCCKQQSVAAYYASQYFPGVTGQVCGFDFQTYDSPAAACTAGVYHTGPCFPQNTNLYCYNLPNLADRVQCVLGLTLEVFTTLQPFAQPVDAVMLMTTPPCDPTPGSNDDLYRHAEGYCNNLGTNPIPAGNGVPPGVDFRWSGAAGNLFGHESPILPSDPAAYIQSGPNPREVSNALFTQTTFQPNWLGVNGLVMAHVNFFIHDFMNHKNDDWNNPIAVPVPITDPVWGLGTPWGNSINWLTTTPVMLIPGTRSDAGPQGTVPTSGFPYRRDLATAWFDASQVYGADTATTLSLRAMQGGLLKMNKVNGEYFLPDAPAQKYVNKPFLAGDYRVNFHPGLTALHTLWAREHNRIATVLALQNPSWTDEQLFQTALIILSAEIIKIHTLEWTNALALNPADQSVTAFLYSRFGCPQPSAFAHATHVVPEEFVAVYKWHSFVPPTVQMRSTSGKNVGHAFDYVAQFQDTTLIRANGIAPILVGLATTASGTMRLNNLAPGLQNIKHPYLLKPDNVPFSQPNCVVVPGLDFAVIDIVRDRERGIPKYNALRQLVALGQLPAAVNFDDLADTPDQALAMALLYRWNINNVDNFVGIHGEHMRADQGFPVTVAAAFVPFVLARAQLDRFYTDDFDIQHYTGYGLLRLAYVDFAQILCDNANICNIPDRTRTFFIWDTKKMNQQTITPNWFGNTPVLQNALPPLPSPPSCAPLPGM
jgi:hypothetical protein